MLRPDAPTGAAPAEKARDLQPGILGAAKDALRDNRLELLVLAVMVAVFYERFLLAGRIFLLRDLFVIHYPTHLFSRDVLLQGALPLWNPYTGCGEPLLASIEAAVWYPPNFLYLLLPVALATAILVACHTWMTGVACYALCRLWQVSRRGALLAAVLLSFNTSFITRIEFLPYHASISWLPVVLLTYALWLRSRRPGWIVATGVALCLQLLAGYPEGALFTVGALGLYAVMVGVWDWGVQRTWLSLASPLLALVAAGLLAALLGMAQILPTWEAVGLSWNRGGVIDAQLNSSSVNPLMLLTLLIPSLYGVPGSGGGYWAPSCFEYWLGSFYLGVVPIVLLVGAVMARLARRTARACPPSASACPPSAGPPVPRQGWLRCRVPFLLVLLLLSVLYAMGRYTYLSEVLRQLIPPLQKFRWPAKSMLCAVFALSGLAGMALDFLAAGGAPVRRGWRGFVARWATLAIFGAAAAFVIACLVRNGLLGEFVLRKFFNLGSVEPRGFHRIPWRTLGMDGIKFVVLAIASSILVWRLSSRPSLSEAAGWLFVLMAFADLFITGLDLLPSGSADLLAGKGVALVGGRDGGVPARFLKVREPDWSMYGAKDERLFQWAREGMVRHWPMAERVFVLNVVGNFKLDHYAIVLSVAYGSDVPSWARGRLLGMVNCDRRVVFQPVSLWYETNRLLDPRVEMLERPLPRAYVVGGLEILGNARGVVQALANVPFDPLELALADKGAVGDPASAARGLKPGRVRHEVKAMTYGPNSLRIDLWSEREGLLVVSDTWYPGWEARVNRQAARIMKVNGAFRGVRVPAGDSTVEMIFRPRSVRVGMWVSGGVLGALVLWLLWELIGPTARRAACG